MRDDDGNLLTTVNPAYAQWIAQDRALITLINATLSKVAYSFVIDCKSLKEVWTALEKRFSSLTQSHIHELKLALHAVSKSLTESIDDYLIQIKESVDNLTTISIMIDDEDVLLYMMNGLPTEYKSFHTSIPTHSEYVALDELHTLLKSEAKFIEQQNKAIYVPAFNLIVMFVRGSNQPSSQGRAKL